jgi:hypothetical protein
MVSIEILVNEQNRSGLLRGDSMTSGVYNSPVRRGPSDVIECYVRFLNSNNIPFDWIQQVEYYKLGVVAGVAV